MTAEEQGVLPGEGDVAVDTLNEVVVPGVVSARGDGFDAIPLVQEVVHGPRASAILAGTCPSVLAPAGESLSVYSVSEGHIPAATLDYRPRSSHPFLCGADAHLRRVD